MAAVKYKFRIFPAKRVIHVVKEIMEECRGGKAASFMFIKRNVDSIIIMNALDLVKLLLCKSMQPKSSEIIAT